MAEDPGSVAPTLERTSVPPSGGPILHPPRQERSRKTLERIAEAALELMAEVGPERATVADIVKRAGASAGSLYARFGGKEDLIRFLQDRVWTEARERCDEALEREDWSALPMESVVEGVVGLLVRTLRADHRSRRALGSHLGAEDPGRALVNAFHQHVVDGVRPLLLARREEISHPDPESAVRWGYRFATGAIREILDAEHGKDSTGFPLDALVPEVARAWTAYLTLGAEDEAAAPDGEVDFFDPWG